MEALGALITGIGYVGAFICGLFLLIIMFQESIVWGLAAIFIPLAALLFVIMNWGETKLLFFGNLLFGVMIIGGKLLQT